MDVAVIGAGGFVGRAVCMQLIATGIVGPGQRLQLVGHRGGQSETGIFGQRADLLDAYGHRGAHVEAVLDGQRIDADIVIMVAGATPSTDPSNPTTRADVAAANRELFESYARMLREHGPENELVLIQSNPVELAVDIFSDYLGAHRVVGAGAYVDTLRFRRELATGLEQHGTPPIVTGYMLGEHGPNVLPAWSTVDAAGVARDVWEEHLRAVRKPIPLAEVTAAVVTARAHLSQLVTEHRPLEAEAFLSTLSPDIRSLVRPWLTHWSGRTSTTTAHGVVDIVALLAHGHRVVLPLQVKLTADQWPGVDTVLGVPVDIDALGWHSVVPLPLTDEEMQVLRNVGGAIADELSEWRTPA